MEGRRRQLQLIGKMLRQRDVDPIRQALDKLKNRHNQQVVVFHKLEQLRDRMVDGSDEAIEEVMNLWPDADRQQLRSLVRNARKKKRATSRQNLPARSSSICVNWRKTRPNLFVRRKCRMAVQIPYPAYDPL